MRLKFGVHFEHYLLSAKSRIRFVTLCVMHNGAPLERGAVTVGGPDGRGLTRKTGPTLMEGVGKGADGKPPRRRCPRRAKADAPTRTDTLRAGRLAAEPAHHPCLARTTLDLARSGSR